MRIRHLLWRHGLKPIDVGCAVAALGLTLSVAGCSADVSRFDFPSFSLNGDTTATGALPPAEPLTQSNLSDQSPDTAPGVAYEPPSQPRTRPSVQSTALADPAPSYKPPRRPAPTSYRPTAASEVAAPTTSSGDAVTVVRGDTLYGLARRHSVSVSELMAANNLSGSSLRPGQTLVLPGSASRAASRPTAPVRTRMAAVEPAAISSNWSGSYEVVPGDSLYRIARQFGVTSSQLQRNNGITDPRRIRPGTKLRVPGSGSAAAAPTRATSAAGRVAAVPPVAPELPKAPRMIQSTTQPTKVLNSKKTRVAALSDRKTDASPSITATKQASTKLLWPVKGKVIDGFGRRRDGTHNDGVNVAVPVGTPVYAAEAGVVAYAGSELKGYGNLILVRHDNGWVTAYAHNESILVKRGDKVARGQPIAKAGKTGQVDQPQVHFELRKGSKPVDPVPYLAARNG